MSHVAANIAVEHSDSHLHPVLSTIYDAATEPSLWPRALDAIGKFFGDAGAILEWRKEDGTYGVVVSHSLDEANRAFIDGNWSQHNFKGELGIKLGLYFSGIPLTDRHLCSEEEMRNHPFFTEFLLKQGLGRFAGISVAPAPDANVFLSVQRSFDKPAYSDSELEWIGVIGPHIERALRLSMRLLDAELVNLGLGDALSRIGVGIYAVDARGRIVFANTATHAIEPDVFMISQGVLRVAALKARNAFNIAVQQLRDDNGERFDADLKPILVESASSQRRYIVYLLPVAAQPLLAQHFLTKSSAIVLAIEQKANEPTDPSAIRDILGVTLGEARVASLIGSGLAPKNVAERLGIAEETARSHLKNVFAKVGVSRQSELVALLAKLMLS